MEAKQHQDRKAEGTGKKEDREERENRGRKLERSGR